MRRRRRAAAPSRPKRRGGGAARAAARRHAARCAALRGSPSIPPSCPFLRRYVVLQALCDRPVRMRRRRLSAGGARDPPCAMARKLTRGNQGKPRSVRSRRLGPRLGVECLSCRSKKLRVNAMRVQWVRARGFVRVHCRLFAPQCPTPNADRARAPVRAPHQPTPADTHTFTSQMVGWSEGPLHTQGWGRACRSAPTGPTHNSAGAAYSAGGPRPVGNQAAPPLNRERESSSSYYYCCFMMPLILPLPGRNVGLTPPRRLRGEEGGGWGKR